MKEFKCPECGENYFDIYSKSKRDVELRHSICPTTKGKCDLVMEDSEHDNYCYEDEIYLIRCGSCETDINKKDWKKLFKSFGIFQITKEDITKIKKFFNNCTPED